MSIIDKGSLIGSNYILILGSISISLALLVIFTVFGLFSLEKDIENVVNANAYILDVSKKYDTVFYSFRKYCMDSNNEEFKKNILKMNANKIESGIKSKMFFNGDGFNIANNKISIDLYHLSIQSMKTGCNQNSINDLEQRAHKLLAAYTLRK